jgi:hypothetical protein
MRRSLNSYVSSSIISKYKNLENIMSTPQKKLNTSETKMH